MHKEAHLTANERVNAIYNLEKCRYSMRKSEYNKGPKQTFSGEIISCGMIKVTDEHFMKQTLA